MVSLNKILLWSNLGAACGIELRSGETLLYLIYCDAGISATTPFWLTKVLNEYFCASFKLLLRYSMRDLLLSKVYWSSLSLNSSLSINYSWASLSFCSLAYLDYVSFSSLSRPLRCTSSSSFSSHSPRISFFSSLCFSFSDLIFSDCPCLSLKFLSASVSIPLICSFATITCSLIPSTWLCRSYIWSCSPAICALSSPLRASSRDSSLTVFSLCRVYSSRFFSSLLCFLRCSSFVCCNWALSAFSSSRCSRRSWMVRSRVSRDWSRERRSESKWCTWDLRSVIWALKSFTVELSSLVTSANCS